MALLIILILVMLAIFLKYMNRIKLYYFVLVGLLIFCILMGNGLIASMLVNPLQTPFVGSNSVQWENKNVIVLLRGGTVKLPNNIVKPSMMGFSRIYEVAV